VSILPAVTTVRTPTVGENWLHVAWGVNDHDVNLFPTRRDSGGPGDMDRTRAETRGTDAGDRRRISAAAGSLNCSSCSSGRRSAACCVRRIQTWVRDGPEEWISKLDARDDLAALRPTVFLTVMAAVTRPDPDKRNDVVASANEDDTAWISTSIDESSSHATRLARALAQRIAAGVALVEAACSRGAWVGGRWEVSVGGRTGVAGFGSAVGCSTRAKRAATAGAHVWRSAQGKRRRYGTRWGGLRRPETRCCVAGMVHEWRWDHVFGTGSGTSEERP